MFFAYRKYLSELINCTNRSDANFILDKAMYDHRVSEKQYDRLLYVYGLIGFDSFERAEDM